MPRRKRLTLAKVVAALRAYEATVAGAVEEVRADRTRLNEAHERLDALGRDVDRRFAEVVDEANRIFREALGGEVADA